MVDHQWCRPGCLLSGFSSLGWSLQGELYMFLVLHNQWLHPAMKIRAIVPPDKSVNIFQWLCNSLWLWLWIVIFRRKVIGIWTFIGKNRNFRKKKLLGFVKVKIGQLSTKLGLLVWWFPSLYAKGHIPLGVRVQPSVTNYHHFEVSTRVTYGGYHSIRSTLTSWLITA